MLLGVLLAGCDESGLPEPTSPPALPALAVAPTAVASMYAADFVATAATGADMNDAGDVTGTSYIDTGCGPFCLPPLETVVWRGGTRIVLPSVPGLPGIYVRAINAQGWVVGLAGFPGTVTHAVLWRPGGTSYTATDLGTLPGTNVSEAVGVDDQGRVVGWSTTTTFPPTSAPFVWSPSTGLVNLATLGFPNEQPLAVSEGGTVATAGFWYRLGNPASVVPMPPPPPGFYPPGNFSTAINDAGDQGRFLVPTSSTSLIYPFRFSHGGSWQQISSLASGRLTRSGMGSIDPMRDITATVRSTGVIAAGPNGLAIPLEQLLSPAYGGATIGIGGRINAAGQILALVMIGRSQRLMRLVPAVPCIGSCIRVSQLAMTGKLVPAPGHPGQCAPGGAAYNLVTAKVVVTDASGGRVGGVRVAGRFLDDYWTDRKVAGKTNAQGVIQFTNKGPCGVGAVAFLVERATAPGRTLDRTTGVLTSFVIPK